MAITIKKYQEKWRLIIQNEEWEFENLHDMEEILQDILDTKTNYGRLNDANYKSNHD